MWKRWHGHIGFKVHALTRVSKYIDLYTSLNYLSVIYQVLFSNCPKFLFAHLFNYFWFVHFLNCIFFVGASFVIFWSLLCIKCFTKVSFQDVFIELLFLFFINILMEMDQALSVSSMYTVLQKMFYIIAFSILYEKLDFEVYTSKITHKNGYICTLGYIFLIKL